MGDFDIKRQALERWATIKRLPPRFWIVLAIFVFVVFGNGCSANAATLDCSVDEPSEYLRAVCDGADYTPNDYVAVGGFYSDASCQTLAVGATFSPDPTQIDEFGVFSDVLVASVAEYDEGDFYVGVSDEQSVSGCSPLLEFSEMPPVCGNSEVEIGEQCDDGNTSNGDGCDEYCQIEAAAPLIGTDDFNQLIDDWKESARWVFVVVVPALVALLLAVLVLQLLTRGVIRAFMGFKDWIA